MIQQRKLCKSRNKSKSLSARTLVSPVRFYAIQDVQFLSGFLQLEFKRCACVIVFAYEAA